MDIIVKELGLFACIDERCGYAVEVEVIARHLRSVHGMDKKAARRRAYEAAEELKALAGEDVEKARAKYHVGDMDATFDCPLPAIRGLPVKACVKCPRCSFVASTAALLRRKHVCGVVSESDGGDSTPVPCLAQTIYGGNKTRYFEVLKEEEANPLLVAMAKVDADADGGPQGDVSRMDGLLAELRFDKTLERFKLDMRSAEALAKWRECALHTNLRSLCSRYMQRAFKESLNRPYIQAHRFMDGKLKLSLQKDSVSKYEVRVSRFMSFMVCAKDLCASDGTSSTAVCGPALRADVDAVVASLGGDEEKSMEALHRVFLSVLFGELGAEQEVVPLYVACASVIGDKRGMNFRYGTAANMSPHLAALKYLGKCVVVLDVYTLNKGNRRERLEELMKGTEDNMDTGLTYGEYCLKTAHAIHTAEGGRVRFVVCNRHAQCGIVDGHELSLRTLGEKMRLIQEGAWDVMRRKLLFGLHIPESFFKRCELVQDNLLESKPGYWIGSSPGAAPLCEEWKQFIASRGRTALLDEYGKVKSVEAQDYLDACEELLKKFAVLMQVCSGGPARMTEVSVLQICNTPESFRNIFVIAGELLYITRYCKSRSLREGAGKVVVRFPDAETSKLLLSYLLIIRPLENAIVELVSDDMDGVGSGARHRSFLFSSRGDSVSADVVRRWFEGGLRGMDVPLGTNQYRHFYTGAVKNFVGIKTSGEEDDGMMFHEQAAHSSSTAHRIYGVSTGDLKNISGEEMDAFRRSSKLWVRALGFEDSPDPQDATTKEAPVTGAVDAEAMLRFQEGVFKRLGNLERMIGDVLGAVKGLEKVPADGKRPLKEVVVSPQEERSKKPRIDLDGSLKVLLKNPSAKFKSAHQKAAVTLCVNKKNDALIILGTGQGKSLCFMLPAFTMHQYVSIVIVPLRALQEDLIRRCQDYGIQAALWEDRETACVRIVFASAEHLVKPEYSTFVRQKHVLGKLYAIFIDEAHIVVTAEDYRAVMQYVSEKVRPSGVEVPLYALTASAPPDITKEIATECGLKEWKMLRGSTARGNIRYRVQQVSQHAMGTQLVATLKQILRNVQATQHAIVYVQTRDECEQVHVMIQRSLPDSRAFKYHGGMNSMLRGESQAGWTNGTGGTVNCMVATNAFGCGIDVGSVRVVVHYGRPSGLLEFTQESGRAGRDGQEALSVVLDNGRSFNGGRKFGNIEEFLNRQEGCRRPALDRYNDGFDELGHCARRGMVLCDLCERQEKSDAGLAELLPASLVSPRRGLPMQEEDMDVGLAELGTESVVSPGRGDTNVSPRRVVPTLSPHRGSVELRRVTPFGPCSPEELIELSSWARGLCAVCSVRRRAAIRHGPKNTGCFKTRCLRCAMPGHDAKDCCVIEKGMGGSCYQCTIGFYKTKLVHEDGTYGTRNCGLQPMLMMAFVVWDDKALREKMMEDIVEVRSMDLKMFSKWLRALSPWKDPNGEASLGLATVGPWLYERVLKGKV